jgi:hypothetical protein
MTRYDEDPIRRSGTKIEEKIRQNKLVDQLWWEDGHGWWCGLVTGWVFSMSDNVHCVRENTLTAIAQELRYAVRCEAKDGCDCNRSKV